MTYKQDNIIIFKDNSEKEIEKFAGIGSYATSNIKGIGGIYKHTYKDFIVREVTKEGEILRIRDISTKSHFSGELDDDFTEFNLVKINKEPFKAFNLIASALKVPISHITYSGLKDRCSISVQKVAVKGNHIEKLNNLKLRDIFINNISPSRKSIKLGSNKGNHFTVIIRNIDNDIDVEKRNLKVFDMLSNNGFLNYYGLQRFGTFRPNSHIVAKHILLNEHENVFNELVLNTYSSESIQSQLVRNKLRQDGDMEWAYANFPNGLNYERMMIHHLKDHEKDFKGSVQKIPSYLIKLLFSSFQSYFFNKMLTLRIKKGISPFEPANGDVIVILDDDKGSLTSIKYIYGGKYDVFLKEAIRLNRAYIVIPLVGYDTKMDEYPLMNKFFEEVLKEEKIDSLIFKCELFRQYEFKGAHRAMVIKLSDAKILEVSKDDIFQDKQKVKIEFSLPKGSYATMVLRELMK
ncbi:MAG: tRNA pseudouridine(13) synthase TruD [Candidatus Lokiarchaeota archaeon]|nr:tRNA pseudouridine(13) synthase TruD [Candidatus Lokiarchaeota archaeon]